jgi:hypothetical protein
MSKILKYYLAKNGQISGPFSDEDIRALEQRGEIFRYSWIWRSTDKTWRAMDPAPTVNPESQQKAQMSLGAQEAYCLMSGGVLKGYLHNATELGFELRMQESWTLPPVGKGMQVQVLRPGFSNEGRLETMKILEIAREDNEWVIFLRNNEVQF